MSRQRRSIWHADGAKEWCRPFSIGILALVVAMLVPLADCRASDQHTIYVVTGPHQDLAYHCTYRESMVSGKPEFAIDGYVKQLREHIEMIEGHPDARFCMGNTYNTKDFVERHPEFLSRLRRLVAEGKIDTPAQWVGWEPSWYSGELLVRGTVGPKWWAMDVLDYEPRWAQLNDIPSTAIQYPQVLAKAGVDLLQVHDAGRIELGAPSDPFLLVALDGTPVIGYAPYGDYYGWLPHPYPNPPEDRPDLRVFMAYVSTETRDRTHWGEVRKGILEGPAADFGAFGDRLMLAIADHGTPAWGSQAIADFAREWNADPEARHVCRIAPATEQEFALLCRERLEEKAWEPEALVGRTCPWPWAGVAWNQEMAAARARAEALLPTVEKLAAINELLGFSKYPADRIDEAWERIMWTTDHNWGFSGRERRETCQAAYELAKGLLYAELSRLASHVDWEDKGTPVVVFNPLNWPRTAIAEITLPPTAKGLAVVDHTGKRVLSQVLRSGLSTNSLADEAAGRGSDSLRLIFQAENVPPLGYKTFYVVTNAEVAEVGSDLDSGPTWLENEKVRVEVDEAGQLRRVFDKVAEREMLDLGRHDFVGVAGYASGGDAVELSNLTGTSARLVEHGPLLACLELRGEYEGVPVLTWITVSAGSPNIDFYMAPEGGSGAKLVFAAPWNVAAESAQIGVPYGSIPVYTDRAGKREVNFSRRSPRMGFVTRTTWYEDQQPGTWGSDIQRWVALGDTEYTIDIGYDNLETRVFFRGAGAPVTHLSAGGAPYGRWHLTIRGHENDWRSANTPRFAWEVCNPLLAVEPVGLGPLPREQSFATCAASEDNVVMTVLKKTHDGRGYVARFYETSDRDTTVSLALDPILGLSGSQVSRADLLERPLTTLEQIGEGVRVMTKGCGIETLRWNIPSAVSQPVRASASGRDGNAGGNE